MINLRLVSALVPEEQAFEQGRFYFRDALSSLRALFISNSNSNDNSNDNTLPSEGAIYHFLIRFAGLLNKVHKYVDM